MTDESGWDGPRWSVEELTEHQQAILALLGGVEAGPRRSIALVHRTHPALMHAAPGLHPAAVKDHACPVVEWGGQMRMILPNGDIQTVPDKSGDVTTSPS